MSESQQPPLAGVAGIWDNQEVVTRTYTEKSVFTFHGEAVHDGTMDAAQFGQALLGYSRMVGQVARLVSPKAGAAEVKVLSTQHGSFVTLLSIAVDLSTVEAVRDWILGANGQALERALNLTVQSGAVLASVVGGAISLGKWKRGRAIARREKIDATRERVVTDDGDSIIALAKVVDVMLDPGFRKGVQDFASPTTTPGIESVTIDGPDGGETITMSDRDLFFDDEDDGYDTETAKMLLKVVRISFDNAPWRFEYTPAGGVPTEFSASIADEDFLDDLAARRVVFGDGDALSATVEVATPSRPRRGARRRHRVLAVHSVVPKEQLEPLGLLSPEGTDLRDLDQED